MDRMSVLRAPVRLGVPPRLDSFFATFAVARLYSDDLKRWFEGTPIVPAFVFYKRDNNYSYLRSNGCHELLPPLTLGLPKIIHMAFQEYDFAVNTMSPNYLEASPFYEYYPAVLSFSQAHQNLSPPRGNQTCVIDDKFYLRLFHHTTEEGKAGILSDRFLKGSVWNFCGTRKLINRHCYFTDILRVDSSFGTLPILIRRSHDEDILFQTDAGTVIKRSGVEVRIEDRPLEARLSFLVSPDLIQPNPMVLHYQALKRPKWLEIMFSSIYRCPCSGIQLKETTVFDGETHWIVDTDSAIDLRANDPISCAHGDDIDAILALLDDHYVPSSE